MIAKATQINQHITTYDERGEYIGTIWLEDGAMLWDYNGSTVTVRKGGTLKTYDGRGNYISTRYISS